MTTKAVSFGNSRGEALAGRLDLPAGEPRAWAIFAHCFTCSKDSKAAAYISQALAARGVAVLRFDFTGLGTSGGEFAESSFSSNLEDLACAAEFLSKDHAPPELLVGHSLGGAAVLAAARLIASARAVVTLGAPFDPEHVKKLLGKAAAEISSSGEATVDIGGRPFRVRKDFLDDLDRHAPEDTIRRLKRALLVMHSPGDRIVGIENAAKIFGAAKHPKSFVSLDDADHLLSKPADAAYAADVLSAWASRYVGTRQGQM